jgi:hypothetical protein
MTHRRKLEPSVSRPEADQLLPKAGGGRGQAGYLRVSRLRK